MKFEINGDVITISPGNGTGAQIEGRGIGWHLSEAETCDRLEISMWTSGIDVNRRDSGYNIFQLLLLWDCEGHCLLPGSVRVTETEQDEPEWGEGYASWSS